MIRYLFFIVCSFSVSAQILDSLELRQNADTLRIEKVYSDTIPRFEGNATSDSLGVSQEMEFEIDSSKISDETRDQFKKSYLDKYKSYEQLRSDLGIIDLKLGSIDTTFLENDSIRNELISSQNPLISGKNYDSIMRSRRESKRELYQSQLKEKKSITDKMVDIQQQLLVDSANLAVYNVSTAQLRDDYFRQYGTKGWNNPRWFEEYKMYPLNKPQWFSEHSKLRFNYVYTYSTPKSYTQKSGEVDDKVLKDAGYETYAEDFTEKDWRLHIGYLWTPYLATEVLIHYTHRSANYVHLERTRTDLAIESGYVFAERWGDIRIKQHAKQSLSSLGDVEVYLGLSVPFGLANESDNLYLSDRVLPQYFMTGKGSMGVLLGSRYTYRLLDRFMIQSSLDYEQYRQNEYGITPSSVVHFNQIFSLSTIEWFAMYFGYDLRIISEVKGTHSSTALTNFQVAPLYNNSFYKQTISELVWGTNIKIPMGLLKGFSIGLMVNLPINQEVDKGFLPTNSFKWNMGIYIPM